MDTVLDICRLCKNYSDFNLRDINMSLEKGLPPMHLRRKRKGLNL